MRFIWDTGSLDTDQRVLHAGGAPSALSPKGMALLEVLLRARPAVLTKDELLTRVWPDSYVSEANLAVLIGEIRNALGDSAKDPSLIRTHFGVGYSWVAKAIEMPRDRPVPLPGPTPMLRIGARRIVLGPGETSIGRDESCDVVINDISVSRLHAVITVNGRDAEIRDESKNGTRVGGVRVDGRAALTGGAVIVLGSVSAEFAVELPDGASTLTIDDAD